MVAMVRLDSQSAKTGFSDVITATIGADDFLMVCHAAIIRGNSGLTHYQSLSVLTVTRTDNLNLQTPKSHL